MNDFIIWILIPPTIYVLWNMATFTERRKAKKYLPINIEDIYHEEIYQYALSSLEKKDLCYRKYTLVFNDLAYKLRYKMIEKKDLEEINRLLRPSKFIDSLNRRMVWLIERTENSRKPWDLFK